MLDVSMLCYFIFCLGDQILIYYMVWYIAKGFVFKEITESESLAPCDLECSELSQ
jgi:hypothetical protein